MVEKNMCNSLFDAGRFTQGHQMHSRIANGKRFTMAKRFFTGILVLLNNNNLFAETGQGIGTVAA